MCFSSVCVSPKGPVTQGLLRAEIKLDGVALLNHLPIVAFRLGCAADVFAGLSALNQFACLDIAGKKSYWVFFLGGAGAGGIP